MLYISFHVGINNKKKTNAGEFGNAFVAKINISKTKCTIIDFIFYNVQFFIR